MEIKTTGEIFIMHKSEPSWRVDYIPKKWVAVDDLKKLIFQHEQEGRYEQDLITRLNNELEEI